MTMAAVLLTLATIYAVILSGFAYGFRRVVRSHMAAATDHALEEEPVPFVSVIVPARDEQDTIETCVGSILANRYPLDRFEVIVVDDLSRDATAERGRSLAAAHAAVPAGIDEPDVTDEGRVRLIQMPPDLERSRAHKKRAITQGIEQARGEIILTTDADCRVPREWIQEMVRTFSDDTALVSGPVLYPAKGTLAQKAQALEFLGLVAVGAGAIGIRRPNLCNGANVAYRKDIFQALGGFSGIDHLTSGDDELLMQKIAYSTSHQVRFCPSPLAAVITDGAPSAWAFFEQRRRWASKGRHYPHLPLRITVAAIFLFYVALLAATLAAPFGVVPVAAVLAAWMLKAGFEATLLSPAAVHFGRGPLLALFIPLQPLHAVYIVVMGLAGALGGYTWKGRRIDR